MPISKLLWGAGFENELRIGFPLFDLVTDREEREGSEHIQAPSGVEDAWITGRDYVIDAEVRWIPDGPGTAPVQTQLSGAVSWQAFLDYARDANALRFIPDDTAPDFYIDNVYLVEPRKGFGNPSADIKRNVRIKLRNATMDFHQALRGIMFEYAPGMSLTDPVAATFSRASAATRRGLPSTSMAAAIGASDASGVLRDRHYDGTLRTTLLEAARNQLVPDPENFGNWTNASTPIVTAGQADPFGGTAAYLIEDDNAAAPEGKTQNVTFTGDGMKAISLFLKQGTTPPAAGNIVIIMDNTAPAERMRATVTWSAGVPSVVMSSGGVQLQAPEPWGNGWYRFYWQATGIVAVNSNAFQMFAASTGGTGDGYFFGANAWDAAYPSSYQGPSLTTRNYDKLQFPFSYLPQGLAILLTVVERGLRFGLDGGATSTVALQLGSSPNRITIEGSSNSVYTTSRFFTTGNASSTTPTGAEGQIVDLLGILRPTGVIQIIKRLDGGAEVAGTASGVLALPGSFGASLVHLGSINGTGNGGLVPLIRAKILALTFGGVTRDTIAKALLA